MAYDRPVEKKTTKSREEGSFQYPSDIEDGSPFVFIGAYPYKSMVDAKEYRTARLEEPKNYESKFCFYIPSSLKFNYNPTIEQVNARVDQRLINGLSSGNIKDVAKGIITTGVNYLALDANSSGIGTAIKLYKDFKQIQLGQIMDPKQLQMFKDAPYLSYNLNYKIVPESLLEYVEMDLMIKTLRFLSTASTGNTQTVGQFLGTKVNLSEEAVAVDVATKDKQIVDEQTALRKEIDNTKDTKKKNDLISKYNKKNGDLSDQSLKTEYTPPASQDTPAPKEKAGTNLSEKISKLSDSINLLASETKETLLNMSFDTWMHPYIFDMYVITPPTAIDEQTEGFKSVKSNQEMDLFRYAKGLILSNLEVSFLSASGRDDIPFNVFGFPSGGWELNMTFSTISKHVRGG